MCIEGRGRNRYYKKIVRKNVRFDEIIRKRGKSYSYKREDQVLGWTNFNEENAVVTCEQLFGEG